MALKAPTTKREVQQFIGMLSFYRSFIPNMSEKIMHLTELTKGRRSKVLKLNKDQLEEFENLKTELCNITSLHTPVFDGITPFIVETDTSSHSVAAALAQSQPDGREFPIAFASAKLTESQRNWSTIEREGYALIFALRKFECYLIGSPVIIITDHNPLSYICDSSPKSARLVRWSMSLQKFDVMAIKHRKRVDNVNCDSLSRLMA